MWAPVLEYVGPKKNERKPIVRAVDSASYDERTGMIVHLTESYHGNTSIALLQTFSPDDMESVIDSITIDIGNVIGEGWRVLSSSVCAAEGHAYFVLTKKNVLLESASSSSQQSQLVRMPLTFPSPFSLTTQSLPGSFVRIRVYSNGYDRKTHRIIFSAEQKWPGDHVIMCLNVNSGTVLLSHPPIPHNLTSTPLAATLGGDRAWVLCGDGRMLVSMQPQEVVSGPAGADPESNGKFDWVGVATHPCRLPCLFCVEPLPQPSATNQYEAPVTQSPEQQNETHPCVSSQVQSSPSQSTVVSLSSEQQRARLRAMLALKSFSSPQCRQPAEQPPITSQLPENTMSPKSETCTASQAQQISHTVLQNKLDLLSTPPQNGEMTSAWLVALDSSTQRLYSYYPWEGSWQELTVINGPTMPGEVTSPQSDPARANIEELQMTQRGRVLAQLEIADAKARSIARADLARRLYVDYMRSCATHTGKTHNRNSQTTRQRSQSSSRHRNSSVSRPSSDQSELARSPLNSELDAGERSRPHSRRSSPKRKRNEQRSLSPNDCTASSVASSRSPQRRSRSARRRNSEHEMRSVSPQRQRECDTERPATSSEARSPPAPKTLPSMEDPIHLRRTTRRPPRSSREADFLIGHPAPLGEDLPPDSSALLKAVYTKRESRQTELLQPLYLPDRREFLFNVVTTLAKRVEKEEQHDDLLGSKNIQEMEEAATVGKERLSGTQLERSPSRKPTHTRRQNSGKKQNTHKRARSRSQSRRMSTSRSVGEKSAPSVTGLSMDSPHAVRAKTLFAVSPGTLHPETLATTSILEYPPDLTSAMVQISENNGFGNTHQDLNMTVSQHNRSGGGTAITAPSTPGPLSILELLESSGTVTARSEKKPEHVSSEERHRRAEADSIDRVRRARETRERLNQQLSAKSGGLTSSISIVQASACFSQPVASSRVYSGLDHRSRLESDGDLNFTATLRVDDAAIRRQIRENGRPVQTITSQMARIKL